MRRIGPLVILLFLPVALFSQGSHEQEFLLYRSLPLTQDTSQLYFINYIFNNVKTIAKRDTWQIREDNRGGGWFHMNSAAGLSFALTNAGNFEPQYVWKNEDTSICVFEFELDSLVSTHRGFYACIAVKLRSAAQRESAYTCTLRGVPRPDTVARTGARRFPIIRWSQPRYDTATTGSKIVYNPIAGYSIWRCTTAVGPWTRLPPKPDGGGYQPYDTTRYEDTLAVNNRNYYYAIRLVYRPVRILAGPETIRVESRLSENSFLIAVGVEETGSPNLDAREIDFRVMPNPMKARVRFQIGRSDKEAVTLFIYNSSGRLVKSFKPEGQMTWDRRDADGVLVPNGVYFVTLQTKHRLTSKKLILE